MYRSILCILGLTTTILYSTSMASAATSYTAPSIVSMTGSNSMTRADVAPAYSPAGDYATTPAALDTQTRNFTGAFYIKNIGWALFSTGSYQVKLDCGSQTLSSLVSFCVLSGTGWSENIGDISFGTVSYNPSTSSLGGRASSYAGYIDMSDIIIPLKPVELQDTGYVANARTTIRLKNASFYEGGVGSWSLTVQPTGTLSSRIYTASIGNGGKIENVDLSLSTSYTFTIKDPTGGVTTITDIIVSPGVPTTTLDTTTTPLLIKEYCDSNGGDSTLCPDGSERRAASFSVSPSNGKEHPLANGVDTYTNTIKLRDQYGNRVSGGSLKMDYTATVKNVQTDITENINYLSAYEGDALGGDIIPNLVGGAVYSVTAVIGDISYTISSSAPTGPTNILQLRSVKYNGSDINIGSPAPLVFDPLFSASLAQDGPVYLNAPHTFSGKFMMSDPSTSIRPHVITLLSIPTTAGAEWRELQSTAMVHCYQYPPSVAVNPLCDWSQPPGDTLSSIAISPNIAEYRVRATYKTPLMSASDATTLKTYIHYQASGKDILYKSQDTGLEKAQKPIQRFQILGQSLQGRGTRTDGYQGDITFADPTSTQGRVQLLNALREKISILSRNRTDYKDVDYTIVQGDITIDNSTFDDTDSAKRAKRTIIAIGGTVTVSSDISKRTHPLVIISLTDSKNTGGDIVIAGSVKDIASSLIAEHSITSTPSNNQLSIEGSFISANILQDAPPTSCPYYVTAPCDESTASSYDLLSQRRGFVSVSDTDRPSKRSTNPQAQNYPKIPVLIIADPRLMNDAPSVLSK